MSTTIKGQKMYCDKCGGEFNIQFPTSIEMLNEKAEAFEKLHKDCVLIQVKNQKKETKLNYSIYLPYNLKFVLTEDKTSEFEEEIFFEPEKFKKGAIWELIGVNNSYDLMIPLGEGYLYGNLYKNDKTYCNFTKGIEPILKSIDELEIIIQQEFEKYDKVFNSINPELKYDEEIVDLFCYEKINAEKLSDLKDFKELPFECILYMIKNKYNILNLL